MSEEELRNPLYLLDIETLQTVLDMAIDKIEFEKVIGLLCIKIAEAYDFEICLFEFSEMNPVISPFFVFPSLESKNAYQEYLTSETDPDLSGQELKARAVKIAIKNQSGESILAIHCFRKIEGMPGESFYNPLYKIADKIANTFYRIVKIDVKCRKIEIIQKCFNYKEKTLMGQAIDKQIIYKLLSTLFTLTRFYIEIENGDGSMIIHYLEAESKVIRECFYRKYENDQSKQKFEKIKNINDWVFNIDSINRDKKNVMIKIQYENSRNFADIFLVSVLKEIGLFLAELVTLNFNKMSAGGKR